MQLVINIYKEANNEMVDVRVMVLPQYSYTFCYSHFSNCSLNSLNCSNISSCHTERTIAHTPPNQDGRATPSPEHVSTADSEDVHSFDDNHTPVSGEVHKSSNHPISNSSDSLTVTIDTKEPEQTDENFNSFHYWRSPLPDISGELEMLSSQTSEKVTEKEKEKEEEEPEDDCPDSKSSHGKATSDQIQMVLDRLQPHMDDPDVQGEYTEPECV